MERPRCPVNLLLLLMGCLDVLKVVSKWFYICKMMRINLDDNEGLKKARLKEDFKP